MAIASPTLFHLRGERGVGLRKFSPMQTYRARNPRRSPLWQCAHRHFATFVATYPCECNPAPAPLRPPGTPQPPAKLPSKKWRGLILKVWHTDPLICPQCQRPVRVISVIDQRAVVKKQIPIS